MMKIKKSTIFAKRVMDITLSIVGVIFLIPLTIIIFLLNLINKDYGPVYYTHKRIGLNGKEFKMIKYRSMVIDADKKLKDLLDKDEELKKEFERTFKLKNDPRITKIGKFLRKSSLDEFPQFLNVLIGSMSLVGPRPIVKKEWTDYYKEYAPICFSVKPGITGMWQAYARSHVETYQERINLDLEYIKNFSLFLDIKILVLTVLSVIKSKGAY